MIIAAVGERWDMTGEAASRTSLDLPGNQQALLEELEKTGKPIILVLMSGRPNSIEWADANVDAILEMKYRLGLFEDPYRYSNEAREKATVYRPEFLEAARDVARKSIVLLKNKDNALPLAAAAKSIAVIGPLGDSKEDMIGSWSAAGDRKTRPVTLLEGMQAGAPNGTSVAYAKGAS